MSVAVTPTYVALIAILMALLGVAASMGRGTHATALGHGENAVLELKLRRFGNLSEWAAMALLVLLMLELSGVSAWWLHAYGIALVALRLLHPFVLFASMEAPMWQKAGRFVAAAGTAMLILAGSVVLLIG